jgi:hypothetical protein
MPFKYAHIHIHIHTEYDFRGERNRKSWKDRCIGLESTLQLSQLAYTVQPIAYSTKVDLAAVFFAREKLARERVFFGKVVWLCVSVWCCVVLCCVMFDFFVCCAIPLYLVLLYYS